MIFESKGIIKEKQILEGTSKKTGNPYKMQILFINDNGIVQRLLVNEYIYNKAQKDQNYTYKAKVDDFGTIKINDIELCK